MPWRALLGPAALALVLLAAGWQVAVPALLRAPAPPIWATLLAALTALVAAFTWLSARRRGQVAPASLPAEVSLAFAMGAGAAGAALYLTRSPWSTAVA